jgi:hypothetical protein
LSTIFQGTYQPFTTCTLRPRKFAQLALIGAQDRKTLNVTA